MRFAISAVSCGVLLLACHHDPPTAAPEPTQQQPLPPASGTPIGYLLDAANTLALNDAQIVKLHEIDDALASDLAHADGVTHTNAGSGSGTPHRGRGSHGGGMSGGMNGGMGRRGGRHRMPPNNAGSGSASDPSQARAAASAQDRATLVHDALVRAFDVLEPTQRPAAKQVLADHDVDVDTPVSEEPASDDDN